MSCGDNYATGDNRLPKSIGMFKRNGKCKKKRKVKDEDEEFVAPVDGLKMPNDDFNEDLRL